MFLVDGGCNVQLDIQFFASILNLSTKSIQVVTVKQACTSVCLKVVITFQNGLNQKQNFRKKTVSVILLNTEENKHLSVELILTNTENKMSRLGLRTHVEVELGVIPMRTTRWCSDTV